MPSEDRTNLLIERALRAVVIFIVPAVVWGAFAIRDLQNGLGSMPAEIDRRIQANELVRVQKELSDARSALEKATAARQQLHEQRGGKP